MEKPDVDIAVVGGGPAGLTAALAASRMNRRVVCLEAGTPRTAPAPHYHNLLGFPEGVSGQTLLDLGREQARQWGAEIRDARVAAIRAVDGGFELDLAEGGVVRARGVVLATGVVDNQPSCGNLYGETPRGVHYCAVCDGYETRGERVAVVGRDEHALDMLATLLDFTPDLHLVLDTHESPRGTMKEHLDAWNVSVHTGPIVACGTGPEGVRFRVDAEDELVFDHVFLALGVTPKTDVAAGLGCALTDEGYIETDEKQATTVALVYAAGDCTGRHKQVTQGMAEGERAALELVEQLRAQELAGLKPRG